MDLIPSNITNCTLEYYLIKVSSRSRIIYWIIIGMVVFGIALLPFIYVDVSIQARGYFQADIERQIVYTPFQGNIIYAAIRNGDRVEKGDTLLVIDSESIKALQTSLNQIDAENNASISDLVILTGLDSINLKKRYIGLVTKRYQAGIGMSLTSRSFSFKNTRRKKLNMSEMHIFIIRR
jgi:multidrug efflux pump subunit AcrA (membrane-fusion protein)